MGEIAVRAHGLTPHVRTRARARWVHPAVPHLLRGAGEITVFAFLFTFMLTSVSFLRERQSGTLERLLASPILLVLGVALSFEARNELQVIQFIPLVLLPQLFLSGLFWPISTLWPPLQWLSKLFPMTYAVRALREVMLAGFGFADVTTELAALALFAIAMMAFGVAALRRLRA